MEERIQIAKEITTARNANPDKQLAEILKNFPGINKSNYWAWNVFAREQKPNGQEEHFPLAVIPARPVKKVFVAKPKDDLRDVAATLLEVAAKLLRR